MSETDKDVPAQGEGDAANDTGWLIEKDDPPVYCLLSDDYDEHWTTDANKALRFARRQDAQDLFRSHWLDIAAGTDRGARLAYPGADAKRRHKGRLVGAIRSLQASPSRVDEAHRGGRLFRFDRWPKRNTDGFVPI